MALTHLSLNARSNPLASAEEQNRILGQIAAFSSFDSVLGRSGLDPLRAAEIRVLQVNVGKLCNQSCGHCHVDASPDRREMMTRETAEACMTALARTEIPTFDITGGAPELNPNFRWMVEQARALGRHVMDRCNLSVLLLPSQADLGSFLASHSVEVIASLPSCHPMQTDAQRGEGVFEKSIAALQLLNRFGYGMKDSGLTLNLVYNPVGAFLPPKQKEVEAQFKKDLAHLYGISFNRMYTITNMPISRFLEFLLKSGNFEHYMGRLANAFNPSAAQGVMCREMISIGWDGTIYDCDFNQMLELPVGDDAPKQIADFDSARLEQRRIVTGNHCFGCTAGTGSSCGGSITS
jgi:radical SAM/Cys-rich protein